VEKTTNEYQVGFALLLPQFNGSEANTAFLGNLMLFYLINQKNVLGKGF